MVASRVRSLVLFACLGAAFVFSAPASADEWKPAPRATRDAASTGEAFDEVVMYRESWALVVGINRYTGEWPSLVNAVPDAKAVAAALERAGFGVDLELDLTGSALDDRIKRFFVQRGANPDARLFLWFAGHGATLDGEGFLVPSDAPGLTKPAFKLRALHMRDFESYVRLAEAKHVLAVFDSCFSGTIFDSRRSAPPPAITRAASLPVRQFISSGDASQEVLDDSSFRKVFVEALGNDSPADANRDGYVTGSEVGAYVADRITNLTDALQTPRYGKLRARGFDRGDFVFVRGEADATEKVDAFEIDVNAPRKGIRPVRVRIRLEEQAPPVLESAPPSAPLRADEKSYTELIEDYRESLRGR